MTATRPAPVDFNPLTRIGRELREERGLDGDLPPGDLGLSVRRARRFVDDPLGLLLDSYRRYGPIFTLRMGTTPTVWMIGPEANHFMLVSGTRHFTWRDGFMGDLIPLVGDGLLTTDGDYHDRARNALTPVFHRRAIESATRVMLEEADAALDEVRPGADLDAYTWTRRLALGIAMRALFGMEADGERRELIAERFENALSFYYRPVWEVMLRGPGTPWSRMQREKARLDALVLEEIARRRARPGGDDIVGVLAETDLADDEIRDQVLTLLFAGHDTTTSTISFLLYELARNPVALDRLVAEIDRELGGEAPEPALLFDGLPQLEMTLAETLRLYPAAWWGPRMVVEPFEFAGHRVPAGVRVQYSSWVSHRLPEVFPQPEAFLPERFAPEAKAELAKGAYIPFGGGTRMCIGKRFGETEIKAIAVRLLQRFRPELQAGFRLAVRQAPTLSPRDGMPLRLLSRR